jgi:hypothetical protein
MQAGSDRPTTAGAGLARISLGGAVVAAALAMPLGSQRAAGVRLGLMLVAAASFALVLIIEARRPFLTVRGVLIGVVVTLAVAVAVPPQGSSDLWSYAAYGRTVAHYHRSPYRTDPDDVGNDAITRRVAPAWEETPSVYGPVFVAVAASGSELAGSSPLANRLFFQGLAALAVLGALGLLARAGADPGALAFLGLNPVVALVVVNAGHNDALVGLGVLAGALLAARRRPVLAGVVLGMAALVKIVAVLPIAAVVVWAWRRGERSPWSTAVGGLATVVLGYAVVGGKVALDPVLAMGGALSRASIWNLVGRVDPVLASPLLSGALVALLIGIVLDRASRAPLPSVCGTALLVYLLGSRYLLPWYLVWALPVLALRWRTSAATVASAAALGLAVSYVGAPHLRSPGLYAVLHPFYTWAMPVALASGLVWLAMTTGRPRGEPDRGTGDPLPDPADASLRN